MNSTFNNLPKRGEYHASALCCQAADAVHQDEGLTTPSVRWRAIVATVPALEQPYRFLHVQVVVL